MQDAKIKQYILNQSADRQNILTGIHSIIMEEDMTIAASVEQMMGKDMIVYKGRGLMKYGLSSVKNYMSLHVLPIYGSAALFSKYKSLLDKANFQKGCINFKTVEEMPLDITRQLIADCSTIDLLKIREDHLKKSKGSKKK